MPNNPSELQRLYEEREELIDAIKSQYLSKASKEECLREVRRIEAILGIEGENYNSSKF